MIAVLALLLAQAAPAERAVLEAEQARSAEGLLRSMTSAPALAARGLGRLEEPAHSDSVLKLLRTSPDAKVRRSAAGALAQMRASISYGPLLQSEADVTVRAALLEAVGRAKPLLADAESLLVAWLPSDPRGAARGLESLFRLNKKRPELATVQALHTAFAVNREEETRELILLILKAAGDNDAATYAEALKDPSPQVRRLAVRGWTDDPSPIVRYEALRVAKSCERATAAVSDSSAHVALLAVDQLGTLKCSASVIAPLMEKARPWRIRAHAIVSMAAVDPAQARTALKVMRTDPIWQVRAYAAKAARASNDVETLALLARDKEPNVAIAALTTVDDAVRALDSTHSGLVVAAAERLKGVQAPLPALIQAFERLTAEGSMTNRDPRVALLTRIGEAHGDDSVLRKALSDRDPAVAAVAARALKVPAKTTTLPIPPLPPAAYIQALVGAQARITMRGLGSMTVDLLTEEAPVTVAVFAQLAEAGKYNGLTFHRIVSNFVIQGGSPGADEFDGRSRQFLRDELGFARNVRGSIGISTRGRDTGDAQIYFNLVDNFRLDRDYTVMAVMREGMDVMDRVQEGDVMERVEIIRR